MIENVFSEDIVGALPQKQAPNKNVLFNLNSQHYRERLVNGRQEIRSTNMGDVYCFLTDDRAVYLKQPNRSTDKLLKG